MGRWRAVPAGDRAAEIDAKLEIANPAGSPLEEVASNREGQRPFRRDELTHTFTRKLAVLGWMALSCIALVPACVSQQSGGQEAPETTVKVDVKLVNVYVTVSDSHGSPVAGLTKENFQLQEDGREQKIAVFDKESALPLSIVLAVDTSLSTRHDLPLEQAAAKRFVRTVIRASDVIAIYGFNEDVRVSAPFTPEVKRAEEGIDRLKLGAATALFDAIFSASRALDRRQGRKVIVLITDGGDTASQVTYREAVRAAEEAEAMVYSVIVVPIESSAGRETGGEHALIQLSEDTGGKYYYADSAAQLDEAFHKISDELRTQYLLAYYPAEQASRAAFRRIEVKVAGAGDCTAHHRVGYYTSKSSF